MVFPLPFTLQLERDANGFDDVVVGLILPNASKYYVLQP